MEKLRTLFIIMALLLITIGIFAGRTKFQSGALFASRDGFTFCSLTNGVTLTGLTTTATGRQVIIVNSNGIPYNLYISNGTGVYFRLYSTLACF
jgi:predicted transporter